MLLLLLLFLLSVAPAGFAMTALATGAAACDPSTYAPAFNRLARCLRCQSGLQEPAASNLTSSQRASKRTVCSECCAQAAPGWAGMPRLSPGPAAVPMSKTVMRHPCPPPCNSFVPAEVPPGRYMQQGLVRWCPQGAWRNGSEDFDSSTAQRVSEPQLSVCLRSLGLPDSLILWCASLPLTELPCASSLSGCFTPPV